MTSTDGARLEDPPLLRGLARFLDDLPFDAAEACFVRSPIANGAITSIDVAAAAGLDGVLAVLTADDLALGALRGHDALSAVFDRAPLAGDRVRFVGEPVAVVVAATRPIAVDAAEAVEVTYAPEVALIDPSRALADDPVLFGEHGTNVVFERALPDGEEVLDGADHVVRLHCRNQRLAAAPMEPDGVLAVPGDGRDEITVWASTQRVHRVRDAIAAALGVDPAGVRVRAPHVGGGFGGKFEPSPETVVVAAAARRLRRPVRWVQTRTENLQTMPHGRAQLQHGALALTADGEFRALWIDVLNDAGAHPMVGAVIPNATVLMAPGPYRIPAVGGRGRAATTNTAPLGAYRGAGRPEATALLERLVDRAGAHLGLDPLDLRRRNLIPSGEPHVSATGMRYDTGDPRACLDAAARRIDYDHVRRQQAEARAAGVSRLIGVAVVLWMDCTPMNRPGEYASIDVRLDPHDADRVRVVVRDGANDQGQSHRTTWARLITAGTGLDGDMVHLELGDTDEVPSGEGAGSARSLMLAGGAVAEAAAIVARQARLVAAHLLEAAPDDIVTTADGAIVSGAPARLVSWGRIAAAAASTSLPASIAEELAAERGVLAGCGLGAGVEFEQPGPTFPYGAHATVVEVDAETGAVEIVRFVAVDDCGTVINPTAVAGQQHGGIAQGIAQALFEEVVYDDEGNPLTSTLADYAVPSAADLPSLDVGVLPTRSPVNALGTRGIGQGGAIGAAVAVQNAVIDAVAHLGVDHIDLPLTPGKVWRAIESAQDTNQSTR
jgi:carbon-monoxide dehydrogenase large subunit